MISGMVSSRTVSPSNVYVMTFTMIDLQHHRGAPAERPMIDEDLLRVDLSDERARYAE
jgi:hypothetical protein